MLTEARDWWEKHAAQYQRQSQIPIDILYGPGAPNEDRLQLQTSCHRGMTFCPLFTAFWPR